MCKFFTLNRSFYPPTSGTTSVRADSSILERYKFCGHKTTPQRFCGHKTTPQRYYVATYAVSTVSGQCNAMSSYWIRQARHTHSMKQRDERKQRKNKNKEEKSKEKKKKKQTVVPLRRGCAAGTRYLVPDIIYLKHMLENQR